MQMRWSRWAAIGLGLAVATPADAQQAGGVAQPANRHPTAQAQSSPQPQPQPQAQPQAPSAVSSDPQMTTATFGDWTLRCQRVGEAQARLCEVDETIQVEGKGTVAQIALGRTGPKEPLLVTVALPTDVTFPSSVVVSIDEKDTAPADLAWRRCLPGRCFADAEMKDDILRRWRQQTDRGRLQFKAGDGREILMPFSFRGLAQALDAMAKG